MSSNNVDREKKAIKKELVDKGISRHSKGDRKKLLLKKAMAHLVEEMSTLDEEEEEYGSLSDNEGNDTDLTVLTNVFDTVAFKCSGEDSSFIVDSGCRGAHICRSADMLESIEEKHTTVQGITGHSLTATCAGDLPMVGRAIVVPKAEANLLSLRQLISEGGYFKGDRDALVVFDEKDRVKLTATHKGDGFWRCNYDDLKKSSKVTTYEVKHYSAEERDRAKRAFDLCSLMGHPSDQALINTFDNGSFTHLDLTSEDFRNARALFGPCLACLEGKIKAPSSKPSTTPPASAIGEHLHVDLLPLTTVSLGGNSYLLIAVDEKTGYITTAPLKSKNSKSIYDGLLNIIHFFNSHGHKVRRITSDDERNFKATQDMLAKYGILYDSTPADLLEKRCERYIQTVKAPKRSVLANLSYELPLKLEGEAYTYVINLINMTPNTVTGHISPYQLVTGERARVPSYYFGQTGIFYSKRKDSDVRGEWGIFLGYGASSHQYLRAYIPLRSAVYSRRKFVPNPYVPPEWNYPARLRPPEASTAVAPDPEVHSTQSISAEVISSPPLTQLNQIVQSRVLLLKLSSKVPSLQSEEGVAVPPVVPTSDNQLEDTFQDSEDDADGTSPPSTSTSITPTSANPATNTVPMQQLPKSPMRPSNIEAIDRSSITEYRPPIILESQNLSTSTSSSQPLPKNLTLLPTKTKLERPAVNSTPIPSATERPRRQAAESTWKDGPARLRHIAYRLTVGAALKDDSKHDSAVRAIKDEIDSMVKGNVMTPISYSQIPTSERRNIIPTHMFLKEKYKSDGQYDKMKGRLVANGNLESPDNIDDTYAPTVNPISVLTVLNIAAATGSLVSSYDIKSAFLQTPIPNSEKSIHVKVPTNIARF